jgi:hypothetical protein
LSRLVVGSRGAAGKPGTALDRRLLLIHANQKKKEMEKEKNNERGSSHFIFV